MRRRVLLIISCFLITAVHADDSLQTLENLRLLRDTQHALICKKPPFEGMRYNERIRRISAIDDSFSRILTAGDTPAESWLVIHEELDGIDDCRTPEEKREDERLEEFWDPTNQRALYCLPQDERVARMLELHEPEHHQLLREYIMQFEADIQRNEPDIFNRLCEESQTMSKE